jgi:hypothetical protein
MKAVLIGGAHAPSRADFGALAEMNFDAVSIWESKGRDDEGVISSMAGACALRNSSDASTPFTI